MLLELKRLVVFWLLELEDACELVAADVELKVELVEILLEVVRVVLENVAANAVALIKETITIAAMIASFEFISLRLSQALEAGLSRRPSLGSCFQSAVKSLKV